MIGARALLSDSLRATGDPTAARPIASTLGDMRAEQQRWAWENLSPPATSEVDVGAADIGYLVGFHTTEVEPLPQGGDITYRWTTSHGYVRLTPPSSSGKLKLVIQWHSLAWPGRTNMDTDVHILADGRKLGSLRAHPGWELVELDLPDIGTKADKAPIVIELLSRVEKPPGEETRYLGVAIDYIKIEVVK